MALNLASAEVGQTPMEKTPYILRVTGVSCVESKNGNIRLDVRGEIVEGPSATFEVRFPAYFFMIHDAAGNGAKTGTWIARTRRAMAQIIGVPVNQIVDIPTEKGERTASMEAMLNTCVEVELKYSPATEEWSEKWEVSRVLRHVDDDEIVPPDWAAFFNN